ncbi:MAG: DUF192 domain-containing protein [Actinomycetota bacterium]|nr:DUF192 domain-containing protein [Actinomycetota bacterium]
MSNRWVVVAGCLLLMACSRQVEAPALGETDGVVSFAPASGEAVRLDVWIADSEEERSRGLMSIEELAPHEGMAFVFAEPTDGTFWMKDTVIPLSIAFVDEAGTIVTIRDMEPCEDDPCPTYGADEPYVLAVEANAGYYARMDIAEGDEARLARITDG